LIDEFLPEPTFEGLRVPLLVLATDVDTGEPVVFREGALRDAVRASCSFPGVFPPMLLEGRRLYDGGISEVIPVRLARELAGDAGVVVAVDCNSGTRWPAADSFVALTLRAGLTLLRGRSRSEMAGADLVVAPSMGESGWMRPTKIPSFCKAGEQALCEAVPEIKRLMSGEAPLPSPARAQAGAAGAGPKILRLPRRDAEGSRD
jgi:NTE family protein